MAPSRQLEDHVAVTLARTANGPEPVDHVGRQLDVSLAPLIDVILVGHGFRAASVEAMASKAAWVMAMRIKLRLPSLLVGAARVRRPLDDAHLGDDLSRLMLTRIRPPSAQLRAANQPNTVHPRSKLKTQIAASYRHLRRTAIIAGRK